MFRSAWPVALVLAVSLTSTALAQTAGGAATARSACQYDKMTLCPGVTGGEAIMSCLISRKEKLGQECRKALEARPRR
jgi:hypothetical protein